jgi:ABC-2 type transport system ATP-binding protein
MNRYAIETDGLTRRFGTQLAVDRLNLQVPEAGVYGFPGPNGAGKTTTIRMPLGLIRHRRRLLRPLRRQRQTRQIPSLAPPGQHLYR